MAYPKPLSEKTLIKQYTEAGLSLEKINFLRALFLAALNLYGAIDLESLWEVYKELSSKTKTIKLLKKDITTFSKIAKRENAPYYILEVSELYEEETDKPLWRYIVDRDLIGIGLFKTYRFHTLVNAQYDADRPFFVPADMLSYADKNFIQKKIERRQLISFLSKLSVTEKVITDSDGIKKPNPNYRKKLNQFYYIDRNDQFEIDYMSGKISTHPKANLKRLEKYIAELPKNEVDYIMQRFDFSVSNGLISFTEYIKFITDRLCEIGVGLSKKQVENLLMLVQIFYNNSNLHMNLGWAPSELHKHASETMKNEMFNAPVSNNFRNDIIDDHFFS